MSPLDRQLRLLRNNASLKRQAYVEFDLEAMFDGEVFADFVLLWLVAHAPERDAVRVRAGSTAAKRDRSSVPLYEIDAFNSMIRNAPRRVVE